MKPKIILPLLLILLAGASGADARRYTYRADTKTHATPEAAGENEMSRGSFMVASGCAECNSGYTIDQISFSGFDKPQSSLEESFFITNHTDRTMTGVTLYVDYRDTAGRQLTRKYYRLSCEIPPGETRQVYIKSWDRQKSFYFTESAPSRRGGQPFTVVFDPVAFYLKS